MLTGTKPLYQTIPNQTISNQVNPHNNFQLSINHYKQNIFFPVHKIEIEFWTAQSMIYPWKWIKIVENIC